MATIEKLHEAVLADDGRQVGEILQAHSELANQTCANGWTALIVASFNGKERAARALLASGADPNRANAKGTTPLMYAKCCFLRTGDPTLMRVLLDHGADPQAVDSHGLKMIEYVSAEDRSRLLQAVGAEYDLS